MESEPETEIWEEEEENVIDDIEPPDQVPMEMTSSQLDVYAMWIVNFLMVMQAVFRLPDTAVEKLLQFIKVIFTLANG